MFVTQQKYKRGFLIPLDIVAAARKEGLGLEQLQEMVAHSTRITHPNGNRRYAGYLFMVEGNRVVAFGRLQDNAITEAEEQVDHHQALSSVDAELFHCPHCKGVGKVLSFDECPRCDGGGCSKCDKGLVPSSIPCPACGQTEKRSDYKA